MIRREVGNNWLLISQLEHARIAAEVAAVWQFEEQPFPQRDLLLSAVRHHDDGWACWETSPTVDTATGKPRDFTEMMMPVASDLWTESIEICAAHNPLGGIWVSRHFCYLAEKAKEHRQNKPDELRPLEHFLTEQARLQTQWHTQVRSEHGENELDTLIETGFHYVQLFDKISLWLCCTPRQGPFDVLTPNGRSVTFLRKVPGEVCISPCPLLVDPLELTTTAKQIVAQSYCDDEELRDAIAAADDVPLRWTISVDDR